MEKKETKLTYIGSVRDAEKAMSDEKRVEQERIQGFCPEGVEDFAQRWFGAIAPIMPVMSATEMCKNAIAVWQETDQAITACRAKAPAMVQANTRADECVEAFRSFVNQMSTTLLSGMPAPSPDAQRIAALEAELAAARAALAAAADQARALRPTAPKTAPAPLAGALRAWPGAGGISQLTGKPNWV